MTWLRSLENFEYILIACFVLLYIAYLTRIIIIASKMKSEFKTVFYKFIIRSFYFALILAALMGPSFGNSKKEIKSFSKEIYIVADISLSMNSEDIQPSRLEKAKQEIKKMIRSFNSDRIGLIVFGSSAYIQCPPTYDQSALFLFTETLSSNLIQETGSDLSEGLKLALNQHLKPSSNKYDKIIILVSDGEDFGANILEIIKEIKKNKIFFLVLGIGSKQGGTIPFNGNIKKDQQGNAVITHLYKEQLQKLAEEADGKYFEINENINESDFLINTVNKIDGTVSEAREVDASENKYFYFLLFALFFIIIDVLITIRTVKI